jgi:hypothetical protein
VYLGLEIDTRDLTLHVPVKKKLLIKALCIKTANMKNMEVRQLARVYGMMLANLLAVGPQLLLLCREGLRLISDAPAWSWTIRIDSLREELVYLAEHFGSLDGQPMVRDEDKIATGVLQTASDASGVAAALVQITCGQGKEHEEHAGRCGFHLSHAVFSPGEKVLSSSWRELKGLELLLITQADRLKGRQVIHWTDSKNVERVMKKGSKTASLQILALELYKSARDLKATINVIWRPRADPRLQLADDWSRAVDHEDWGLSPADFENLQGRCQRPFAFDLFASDQNHRVPRFASLLASDKAVFRDAFTQNWKSLGFCYVQPPIPLIGATIRKIVRDGSYGLLIVPHWKSTPSWLFVCEDGVHANNLFTWVIKFWPFYQNGEDSISETFLGQPKFASIALVFDGTRANPLCSSVRRQFCLESNCVRCSDCRSVRRR